MPPMEERFRKHDALLWEKTGEDDSSEPTFAEPVALKVRWVAKKRDMRDPQGNKVTVDAVAVAAQEIAVGSLMWKGTEEEWYGSGSSGQDTGRMVVVAYNETDDLRVRATRRTVGLARYQGGATYA